MLIAEDTLPLLCHPSINLGELDYETSYPTVTENEIEVDKSGP